MPFHFQAALAGNTLGAAVDTMARVGDTRRFGPPSHPVPASVRIPFDRGQWTDMTIEALRQLWGAGYSTAPIAFYLGFTKNAIIGKVHRLDLPGRPSPIRNDPNVDYPQRRPQPPRVKGPTLPPLASIAAADASEPALAVPRAPDARPRPSRAVRTPVVFPTATSNEPVGERVMLMRSQLAQRAIRMRPVVPEELRIPAAAKPYGRVVTCCWPIGEPGAREFHFCEVPSEPGRSYCEDHVRIAYVRVRDRHEDYAT